MEHQIGQLTTDAATGKPERDARRLSDWQARKISQVRKWIVAELGGKPNSGQWLKIREFLSFYGDFLMFSRGSSAKAREERRLADRFMRAVARELGLDFRRKPKTYADFQAERAAQTASAANGAASGATHDEDGGELSPEEIASLTPEEREEYEEELKQR